MAFVRNAPKNIIPIWTFIAMNKLKNSAGNVEFEI